MKHECISLVCIAYACQYPTDEETIFATFIKNKLEGKPNDYEAMVETIRNVEGARFLEPGNQAWSPDSDFKLCLDYNALTLF